jgi:putative membrane protein
MGKSMIVGSLAFVLGLSTAPVVGQQAAELAAKTSSADAKFLKEAADGGMAEVELGQLAASRASSSDVKRFGLRMVDDHGKANDELKQLALQKHVDLPPEPSAKHKATKARLEKLSGEQFDKAYMADMLQDHKKDVAAFQLESKSAQDPDVKSFAASTLPTLQEHLKQAESLASGSK